MCQYTYTCYTSYFKKCCIFCFAAPKINQSVLPNLVVDWVIHSSGRLLTKTPNTTDACLSVFEPQWSWSSLRVNVSNLWNCSVVHYWLPFRSTWISPSFFVCGSCWPIFNFWGSLFVFFCPLFWPLYCLSFELWLMITSYVRRNTQGHGKQIIVKPRHPQTRINRFLGNL
jgi:hypothetical protein